MLRDRQWIESSINYKVPIIMSEHGPWSKIISRNESALGYGINVAFTLMCNEYHTMIPDHENNLSSSDLLHNDSSFAGFTLNWRDKAGINYPVPVERPRGRNERASRSSLHPERGRALPS